MPDSDVAGLSHWLTPVRVPLATNFTPPLRALSVSLCLCGEGTLRGEPDSENALGWHHDDLVCVDRRRLFQQEPDGRGDIFDPEHICRVQAVRELLPERSVDRAGTER